jgi:hypothetical protein
MLSVRPYPGYTGAFTREDYEGAGIKAGGCVRKVNSERDDSHPNGSLGTVLGSIGVDGVYGYFVEWDVSPKTAVFVMAAKVEKA